MRRHPNNHEQAVRSELQPDVPEWRLDFLDSAFVQRSMRASTFRAIEPGALAARAAQQAAAALNSASASGARSNHCHRAKIAVIFPIINSFSPQTRDATYIFWLEM